MPRKFPEDMPEVLKQILSRALNDISEHENHTENAVVVIELHNCDRIKGKYSFNGHTVYPVQKDKGLIIPTPLAVNSTTVDLAIAIVISAANQQFDAGIQWICQHNIDEILKDAAEIVDTPSTVAKDKPHRPS